MHNFNYLVSNKKRCAIVFNCYTYFCAQYFNLFPFLYCILSTVVSYFPTEEICRVKYIYLFSTLNIFTIKDLFYKNADVSNTSGFQAM